MTHSREFIRAAAIAVALPCLIVLIALIQYTMYTIPFGESEARLAAVHEELDGLRAERERLRAERPAAARQPAGRRNSEAQLDAMKRQQERSARMMAIDKQLSRSYSLTSAAEKEALHQKLRRAAALLALAAGLAAAAAGAAGLAGIVHSASKAVHSRDYLIAAFSRWRTALPLLLIVQTSALVISLAAVLAFFAMSGAMEQEADGSKMAVKAGFFGILVLVFGGIMIWRIAKTLREAFLPVPEEIQGSAADRSAAPELWQFTEETARRVSAAAPDNIVIGLGGGFFVTERPLVPSADGGRRLTGRTLYLPLPLTSFLDWDETAAIIGHELRHFAGDDLEYSRQFIPIYSAAERSIAAIGETAEEAERILGLFVVKPLMAVAVFFFSAFDRVVLHWSRQRELAADLAGSAASSARAAGSALLRTSAADPVIGEVLRAVRESPEKDRPCLLGNLMVIAQARGLEDIQPHLEAVQAHPTDTHPTVRERLDNMGISHTDPALLAAAARHPDPAQSVLAAILPRADELCGRLVQDFQRQAVRQREKIIAALEETAAEGETSPPFEIHEKTGGLAVLELGIALLLAGFAVFAGSGMGTGGRVTVWGFAALMFWASYHFYRRGRVQPAAVFTASGVRSPGLAAELPWTAVEDYRIIDTNGKNYAVELALDETFPAPVRAKSPVKCSYKKKKHQLTLSFFGIQKIEGRHVSGEVIAEELERRLSAVRARTILENTRRS